MKICDIGMQAIHFIAPSPTTSTQPCCCGEPQKLTARTLHHTGGENRLESQGSMHQMHEMRWSKNWIRIGALEIIKDHQPPFNHHSPSFTIINH